MKPNKPKDPVTPARRAWPERLRRWLGRRPQPPAEAEPGLLVAQASHPGRRDYNEDRFGWFSTAHGELFLVADGLGGHNGGQEAAETVLAAFRDFFEHGADLEPIPKERITLVLDSPARSPAARPDPEALLLQALLGADHQVYQKGEAEPALAGLGSTVVALLLRGEEAWYTHAGDSRLYLFSRGRLRQLTRDHSLVQEMVDSGRLSLPEAEKHPDRHLLTQSLGGYLDPGHISGSRLRPSAGDLFLLCSDGLTGPVSPENISRVLEQPWSLQRRAEQLVELALAAGGSDNVTVQLVSIP